MFIHDIYKHYGLSAGGRFRLAGYEAAVTNKGVFIIVPADHVSKPIIEEWKMIGSHLQYKGERNAALVYLSNRQQAVTTIEGKKAVLLHCQFSEARQHNSLAEQLALFHERGKGYRGIEKNSYLPWNKRWETRIDQLEHWLTEEVSKQEKKAVFDEVCLQSFSYFQGLAENAIQYFVDTQIEQGWIQGQDLTIAHHRFHEQSWLFIPQLNQRLKLPFHWLIDHPMRDLAEYIRPTLLKANSFDKSMRMIHRYTKRSPLTSKEYRLLFSRLLFPLYYVEYIEGYYSSKEDKQKQWYAKKMNELLERTGEMEEALKKLQHHFSQLTSLPKVEWLTKKAAT
ncbi:spore coat putative kinase YutH [Bacillus taeanensis]|uniref:spore coat putative kinase YutH n=1 Tax=Bacillus taeanensis TaxID=273032 RepID=UPI0015F09474|nr:spore coat protein YutH [Bacillus taeanensis]